MSTTTETNQPEARFAPDSPYTDKPGVAKMLGVGVRTIDVWMDEKFIPYIKIGRTVRFVRADIQSKLRTMQRGAK